MDPGERAIKLQEQEDIDKGCATPFLVMDRIDTGAGA